MRHQTYDQLAYARRMLIVQGRSHQRDGDHEAAEVCFQKADALVDAILEANRREGPR